jgi:RimJ/RimL family protein N-acetyltransferase
MRRVQPVQLIIGKRIELGPVDLADVPDYTRWVNDPGIQPYLNRPWPVTEHEEAARLRKLIEADDAVGFAIRLRGSRRLIGRCAIWNIHRVNRSGLFTIFIGAADERDKGLGREATALTVTYGMDVLGLNRLELEVFAYNDRAIRLYESLGFVREGVRRQARFHDGAWHDGIQMSILASEWTNGLRARFLDHMERRPGENLDAPDVIRSGG